MSWRSGSQPPSSGRLPGGPILFWAGVAVFSFSVLAGLFRSFAAHHGLPPVGVEYNTELERLIREHGAAAVLPRIRSAARIDFDNEMAVARLLKSAQEAGASEDVLWALTALARLKPEDAQVRSRLASELLHQGQATEALTQATFAVWLAPGSCEAFCGLGDALWALGQKPQAAAAYRRALELDPTSEAARTAVAVTLRGL